MAVTGKKYATEDWVLMKIRALEQQVENLKAQLAASVPAVGEDGSVNYVESITTDGSGHVTAKSNKSMIFNKGHFKETG